MAVTGLQRLNRKLSKEIPRRAYDSVRKALEQNAEEIVAAMKRAVPVDSGDLQMSIKWCWGNAPKGTMTIGQVGRRPYRQGADTTGLRISIYAGGNDEYYAWFVEFGTELAAAQPFFYPVYRARKRSAKSRLARAVTAAVKSAAR